MIDWIARRRHRLFWILAIYFALHAVIRAMISQSLVFDESEQVFLTQWLSLGYNSQPPLYTWVQFGLFEIFGTSVLAISVLKNACLLGTYLFVFGFVYQTTKDVRASIVASIGLATIPQIGYESHRDLSHTVAVTLASAALFYSTVRVVGRRSLGNYAALGIVVGIGVMSKYNFAMVVLGLIGAAASLPGYRKRLLDPRILVSVLVAAAMIVPHAIWMLYHSDLVSEKTLAQLTESQSANWLDNVGRGMIALLTTILGCCAASLGVFAICFRERLISRVKKPAEARNTRRIDDQLKWESSLLLERFLLITLAMLAALVMTGDAVEFKNRWLQPFIVMLPAYLTLRFLCQSTIDTRSANRLCIVTCALMLGFTVALVVRPVGAGLRQKYTWLNFPYDRFADVIRQQTGNAPSTIVASDMRLAGNLRIHFPDTTFVSQDHPHLQPESFQRGPVVLVANESEQTEIMWIPKRINAAAHSLVWKKVLLDYRYGSGDDAMEFFFAVVGQESSATSSQPASHVGSTANKPVGQSTR